MALHDKPQLLAAKVAEGDLSSSQYKYVGKGTSDIQVIIAGGAAGEVGLGWLMNKPKAGINAEVAGPGGGCKVKLEGTVLAGGQIMANANGNGIAATGAGAIVSAIAKEGGVTGDVIAAISVITILHA